MTCDINGDGSQYRMGMAFGLDDPAVEVKRKFRWLFQLEGISALDDVQNGVFAMPPRQSARPSLTWKEADFQHLTETIYRPMKPDWKTINLVLFDLHRCDGKCNVVMQWLQKSPRNTPGMYNPRTGEWNPVVESGIIRDATLVLLDGCGFVIEKWVYENVYPLSIDWGELNMDLSDVVTVDLTLRYDRAYQVCDEQIVSGGASGSAGVTSPGFIDARTTLPDLLNPIVR